MPTILPPPQPVLFGNTASYFTGFCYFVDHTHDEETENSGDRSDAETDEDKDDSEDRSNEESDGEELEEDQSKKFKCVNCLEKKRRAITNYLFFASLDPLMLFFKKNYSRDDWVKKSFSLVSGINLALKKPVWQSSDFYGGVASRAVDGNRYSDINMNSCSHTADDNPPWITVDLEGTYEITEVVITNRGDCCCKSNPTRVSNLLYQHEIRNW